MTLISCCTIILCLAANKDLWRILFATKESCKRLEEELVSQLKSHYRRITTYKVFEY